MRLTSVNQGILCYTTIAMTIKEQIDQDLKQAMLGGNKQLATTLRGLKSAILYEEVAQNKRQDGLTEDEVIRLLQKELKKRKESADLYAKGGSEDRAKNEQAEAKVIENYLPQMMSEEEIQKLVEEVIQSFPDAEKSKMGIIIAEVRKKSQGRADGATIARMVKERL